MIEQITISYLDLLNTAFTPNVIKDLNKLCTSVKNNWENGGKVFICGNGGSAANAIHISNDLIYGAGNNGKLKQTNGVNIEALTANTAIMTCLANDTGYDKIFSYQLKVKATKKDILIVLSGSGNSSNILEAIREAHKIGMEEFSIVAFDGGKCKNISNNCIHINVNDMQIAEDSQMIIGHIMMKFLCQNRGNVDCS